MNTIKRILWGLMIAIPVFALSGCKKFLDRKPLSVTLDDLPGGGLQGQILGIYATLRSNSGTSTIPYLAFNYFRDEDAMKGSAPTDGPDWEETFDNFQYKKDYWASNTYWDDHYSVIGLCNTALQFADSLSLKDSSSIINIAEARFIRAFLYFDLVRSFGQVPKIDFRVYNAIQANIPKSPDTAIYALIDADLLYAEQNLPLRWTDPKFPGRLTTGAAKTLHAKTHLQRSQWANALPLCQNVISSGVYKLHENYAGIFTESGENGVESIFEVQNYLGNNGVNNYGNNYGVSQGVRGAGDWDLGWGWNVPTQNLVDAYEPGDPRRKATILFSGQNDSLYGRTVPSYPDQVARPYWNKKVYTDPVMRVSTGSRAGVWVNMRVLRYADVLLMAAEAANETGNGALAENLIEQVRVRARAGNNAILPKITFTSQAQMRAAIQQERRIELAMEGGRFFDLVRWNLASTILGPQGYLPKHKYYPIPQPTIDKSGGKLAQNPDYQ